MRHDSSLEVDAILLSMLTFILILTLADKHCYQCGGCYQYYTHSCRQTPLSVWWLLSVLYSLLQTDTVISVVAAISIILALTDKHHYQCGGCYQYYTRSCRQILLSVWWLLSVLYSLLQTNTVISVVAAISIILTLADKHCYQCGGCYQYYTHSCRQILLSVQWLLSVLYSLLQTNTVISAVAAISIILTLADKHCYQCGGCYQYYTHSCRQTLLSVQWLLSVLYSLLQTNTVISAVAAISIILTLADKHCYQCSGYYQYYTHSCRQTLLSVQWLLSVRGRRKWFRRSCRPVSGRTISVTNSIPGNKRNISLPKRSYIQRF